MIKASLTPNAFPAQQETDLRLEVRNVGDRPCKQVKLRLERPDGLLVVGGSARVEAELLAPGEQVTCRFTVWADAPGRFAH